MNEAAEDDYGMLKPEILIKKPEHDTTITSKVGNYHNRYSSEATRAMEFLTSNLLKFESPDGRIVAEVMSVTEEGNIRVWGRGRGTTIKTEPETVEVVERLLRLCTTEPFNAMDIRAGGVMVPGRGFVALTELYKEVYDL